MGDLFMSEQDLLKHLGRVIKQLRVGLGLSQEQLADYANLHRTYITDLEAGRRNISIKLLMRVAEALDMDAWRLVQLAETQAAQGWK